MVIEVPALCIATCVHSPTRTGIVEVMATVAKLANDTVLVALKKKYQPLGLLLLATILALAAWLAGKYTHASTVKLNVRKLNVGPGG